MNYLKTFYPQDDTFTSTINYKSSGESDVCDFGFSGDSLLKFNLSGGIIKVNDIFFGGIQQRGKVELKINGSNDNVTVWLKGKPIINTHQSGFSFNSIFYNNASSGSVFSEKIYGTQPSIGHNLLAWDNNLKSGNLVVYNSGNSELSINSIVLKDVYAQPAITSLSIPSGSSGLIPLTYSGFSNFSGLGRFELETNAGDYTFQEDFQTNPTKSFRLINVSFDSEISNPTGQSNFFIENKGLQDETVEIFFDFVEKQNLSSGLGQSTYADGSGLHIIDHSNSGYFKNMLGIGGFQIYVNETINGSKNYQVEYTGNFTGIGGRLDATGVQQKSGRSSLSIYPQGTVINNYNISAESYVSGILASATMTGSRTGIVGAGSGYYRFYETIVAPVSSATVSGGIPIPVTTGDFFTGILNQSISLSANVSGNKNYYVIDDVEVFEGSGNFREFWNVKYYDVDRGLEDFVDLGRTHSSGFGQSGVSYRIPSGTTTSGTIFYNNDYSQKIFQSMCLKITDYSSISKSLYINSKGIRP